MSDVGGALRDFGFAISDFGGALRKVFIVAQDSFSFQMKQQKLNTVECQEQRYSEIPNPKSEIINPQSEIICARAAWALPGYPPGIAP